MNKKFIVTIAGIFATLFIFILSSMPHVSIGNCIMLDGRLFKIIEEGKYSFKLIDEYGNTYISKGKVSAGNDLVDCFDKFW